jgi:hypothetical protein
MYGFKKRLSLLFRLESCDILAWKIELSLHFGVSRV